MLPPFVRNMPRAEIRPDIRFAWRGPSLFMVDTEGRAGPSNALTGLWFRETRYLGTLAPRIDGTPLHLCAIGSSAHDRLELVYVHPELTSFGGGGTGVSDDVERFDAHGIPFRALDVRVVHRVRANGMDSTFQIGNGSRHRVRFTFSIELAADFADLLDVVGGVHATPRAMTRRVEGVSRLELRFTHPQLPYATAIDVPDAEIDGDGARWDIALDPRESRTVTLGVRARDFADPITWAGGIARERAAARWRREQITVEVKGSGTTPLVIARAIEDFGAMPLLDGAPDEWLALQAGVPLYPALFGRDALTAGWHASLLDGGRSLDASLTRLGRLQSSRFLDFTDEEPGRIPYQARSGPTARLGENPFAAYYADFASPLMYVISLVQLFAWTGDAKQIAPHVDVARRILDWARDTGDMDGDGYLEYLTRSPHGTKNQAWKDSGDAMIDERGAQLTPPIAACEIQAYWFAAQELFAILLWLTGERHDARDYWRSATKLKERFNRDFWMEDEGFYGLALDPEKRLSRSLTSNVGHCIAAGIIDRDRLPRVVDRLFAPDLFSGWGVRTLSRSHPSYSPLSYHNGSVWPVEQATMAFGLRRFGFEQRALQLSDATFALAALYPDFRIPECIGGYDASELAHPGAYPQANAPQTWNVSAVPSFLHSMMGILPVASLDLLVVDPVLPTALDEVLLSHVRVGGAEVDLRFFRDAKGRSHFDVLRKKGTLHVVRQPPPESISVGIAGRFGALLDGLRAA
jgi:glycogen debranching enzyme